MAQTTTVLRGREKLILMKLADVLVPAGGAFARGAASKELIEYADGLLSRCTRFVQLFARLSIWLFELGTTFMSCVGTFTIFSHMEPEQRRRYVAFWEQLRLGLLRGAFLMIKAVVMTSFYDDREVARELGYCPGCNSPLEES